MLELLLLIISILVLVWMRRRREHFQYFKKLNIPGPEPSLFSGNACEYYEKQYFNAFRDWHEAYGTVVGVFIGYKPMLLVADAALLRNIYIKDFTDFTDRSHIHGTIPSSESLLALKGSDWKSVRQITTPSFTSSKLKTLASPMHAIVGELISNLRSRANHEVDMKNYLQALTLDVICRSALGANYTVQRDIDNNKLFKSTKQMFEKHIDIPHMIGLSIGVHSSILDFLRACTRRRANSSLEDPVNKLYAECAHIVKARRAAGTSCPDILQLLMNASATLSDDINADELTAGDKIEGLQSKKILGGAKTKLTDDQIVQNAFAILIAGFETTGSTLAYLVNVLIHFPEVQEKLLEELHANIESLNDMQDFDKIQKLVYMDAVVKETLRLFPPVGPFSTRSANVDKTYDTLRIPKGLDVIASIEELHLSSEYWSNPTQFDPSRFARGEPKDPIAWQPFGTGPRNCIGLRFAQMELKMTLAEMIQNFRFELCSQSPSFPPCRQQIGILARLKGPLICRVVPRSYQGA